MGAILALLAAPALVRSAAGSSKSHRAKRAETAIAHYLGAVGPALHKRPGKTVARDVRKARRALKNRAACIALARLDASRLIVENPKSYRSSHHRRARAERRLRVRLAAAEHAVFALRPPRLCVTLGRRTRKVVPHLASAIQVPLPPPGGEHEQGEPPRHSHIPRHAKRSLQDKTSFTPAALPGASGAQAHDLPGGPLAIGASDPVAQVYARTDLGNINPSFPEENQVASGHGVVVYSGNVDAYYSIDAGSTFTRMDPATVFGAGLGGLCCDTLVRYAPSVDRFIWLLQGDCGDLSCLGPHTTTDRYRLAVASPEAIAAAARAHRPVESVWDVYDLTPSIFGDGSSPNLWYDFPDMSIGAHALYMSWNRIGGTGGPLLSRMNLAQIASGGPASVFFWIRPRGAGFVRAVQGLADTGYYASGADSGNATMAQLMSSPGDSPFLTTTTLSHTAVPDRDYCSDTGFSAPGFACPTGAGTPGSTGDDWANRQPIQGNVVQGATLGGSHHDQLWLAWTAGRGYSDQPTHDAWSQPHIQFDGYHVSTLSRLFEGVVYNPCCGIEFPYLNSNAAGDVGISFAYGGPTVSNRPGAGILVPASPPQLDSFFDVGVGDRINPFTIPAGVFVNRAQGDYTTIQPDGDNPSLFVTGGPFDRYDTVGTSTVPRDHWEFARFGFGAPPSPPHVVITSPPNGSSFASDMSESFHGSAIDWLGHSLIGASQLQWSEDGTPFGSGTTATLVRPAIGDHTITLQATDAGGRVGSASIRVQVTAPPPRGDPSVTIDAPIDGQNYPNGNQQPIQFTAHGNEASGGALVGSDVRWADTYTDADGITQHVNLGPGLSFSHTLYWNSANPTPHTITITATDPVDHRTATDTVQITVGTF